MKVASINHFQYVGSCKANSHRILAAMKISIAQARGMTLALDVEPSDTINTRNFLKQKIQDAEGHRR